MNTIDSNTQSPPNAPAIQSDPPKAILLKLKIPLLFGFGDGAVILSDLFRKTLCQALRDKGMLVQEPPSEKNNFKAQDAGNAVTIGTQTIAFFQVTDLKAGLETIRDELASLEALKFSEIGYMDIRDGTWRGWQPPDAETDFPAVLALFQSWVESIKKQKPQ
jgi:hypothetical protein